MWKSAGRAPSLRVLPWHLPYKWGKTSLDILSGPWQQKDWKTILYSTALISQVRFINFFYFQLLLCFFSTFDHVTFHNKTLLISACLIMSFLILWSVNLRGYFWTSYTAVTCFVCAEYLNALYIQSHNTRKR